MVASALPMLYQWSMTHVDAVGTTAKQRQVRASLERLIATLSPGEPFPVERDLARDLGVARMTLRRAVDLLVPSERLIRRQGSGTFVASPKVTQRLTATSFSADMRARGLRPGGHTVFARVIAGRHDAAPACSAYLRTRTSCTCSRVRTADEEPMALEDLHVPCEVAPGLTGQDLEDTSFYELLAARYGTPIVAGTQTVEPCLTSVGGGRAAGRRGRRTGVPVRADLTDGGRPDRGVRPVGLPRRPLSDRGGHLPEGMTTSH